MKIWFFAKPSKVGNPASEKMVTKTSKTLKDCRTEHTKGELTLSRSMTAGDLKQTLADTYGLSIIILRRSGTEWIEIANNEILNP